MDQEDVAHAYGQALLANADLTGALLAGAARDAARISARQGALLFAVDGYGERIVGAALAFHADACQVADRTFRVDGKALLLVSGAIAGPVGLMQAAAAARSLGAVRVEAAVLGGWPTTVAGLDCIHRVGAGDAASPAPRLVGSAA